MIGYIALIHKFEKKAEKTGWTYIEIPPDIAQKLKPGNKKSFRVKGKLDNYAFKKIAVLPMGNGVFILPINAVMRKGIGKQHGAMLKVQLEEDKSKFVLNRDMMACLEDEPSALSFFNTLTGSHQRYFSKWVDGAKTDSTKAKRIAQMVNALSRSIGYPEMLRSLKGNK